MELGNTVGDLAPSSCPNTRPHPVTLANPLSSLVTDYIVRDHLIEILSYLQVDQQF